MELTTEEQKEHICGFCGHKVTILKIPHHKTDLIKPSFIEKVRGRNNSRLDRKVSFIHETALHINTNKVPSIKCKIKDCNCEKPVVSFKIGEKTVYIKTIERPICNKCNKSMDIIKTKGTEIVNKGFGKYEETVSQYIWWCSNCNNGIVI
ncbi:MAG: hypothetical protein KGI06_01310 [Candidatus Micrarchaeota archaeon]|nr:hypothetical protein [Candidatus Micrarchaeota archaeon]